MSLAAFPYFLVLKQSIPHITSCALLNENTSQTGFVELLSIPINKIWIVINAHLRSQDNNNNRQYRAGTSWTNGCCTSQPHSRNSCYCCCCCCKVSVCFLEIEEDSGVVVVVVFERNYFCRSCLAIPRYWRQTHLNVSKRVIASLFCWFNQNVYFSHKEVCTTNKFYKVYQLFTFKICYFQIDCDNTFRITLKFLLARINV